MQVKCKYDKLVSVSELKSHPKNSNRHNAEQIQRLAQILEFQGWRRPIRVSTLSGYITAGHGALEAAKFNGWDNVPVDFQDYDNSDQEIADVTSDNAIAAWAELDFGFINSEIIPELGPDFSIDLLGIENFELEPADKYADKNADNIPEKIESICKPGDLWQLGEHRLLCADCTIKENVERLMNGEKADMVFTDPPYNVAGKNIIIASTVRQSMQNLKNSEWDKNFDPKDFLSIMDWIKPENGTVYICTSHHLAGKIFEWQVKSDAKQGGYVIWNKPNPMPSLSKRHWTWDHEIICYSTYGKHVFNFPNSGHAPATWIIQKNSKNELHPTQKPVAVPEHAIIHSSNPGMLIWDGFLGSGSTLIACEKTGRRCFGMEIDPHYCDVIIQRYKEFTEKDNIYLLNNKEQND